MRTIAIDHVTRVFFKERKMQPRIFFEGFCLFAVLATFLLNWKSSYNIRKSFYSSLRSDEEFKSVLNRIEKAAGDNKSLHEAFVERRTLLKRRPRPFFDSYPFVSGATFKAFADIVITRGLKRIPSSKTRPYRDGDVVVVDQDRRVMKVFCTSVWPKINRSVVLITVNSDDYAPAKHYLG